jgi:hypothetical protein
VPSIHSYFSNKWFIKRFFIKETETRRGRNYFTLMTGSTSMKVASPSFILPMDVMARAATFLSRCVVSFGELCGGFAPSHLSR